MPPPASTSPVPPPAPTNPVFPITIYITLQRPHHPDLEVPLIVTASGRVYLYSDDPDNLMVDQQIVSIGNACNVQFSLNPSA